MNFFKSFSITFFSTFLLTVLGIVNNIIVTRQIGVVDRGKYAVIMNFVMIVALVLGEGLKRSNTILAGQNKNYSSSLSKQTAIIAILLLLLILILNYFNLFDIFLINISDDLILISIIAIGLYIYWQSIQSLFLGIQALKIFNVLQVLSIITVLLINVVGITFFNFSLYEIIFTYLIATFISAAFAFINVEKIVKAFTVSEKVVISKIINLGGKSTLSGLFSFIMVRSGIFFSNYYLDATQTGLYSIALLFFEIAQKIPNTLGTLVLSRSANDTEQKDLNNIARLTRIMFLVNFIFIIGIIVFGEIGITFLFGSEFENSYSIMIYMLPAFFFIGPSSILHAFYMGKGYPNKIIILNAISALSTVIILFFFIEQYGINLVAGSSSLVIGFWTITLIVFFKLDSKMKFSEILIPLKSDLLFISNEIKSILKK